MEEIKIYNSLKNHLRVLPFILVLLALALIGNYKSQFRLYADIVFYSLIAFFLIREILRFTKRDIKLLINKNGISLEDGELITWKNIGIIKLNEIYAPRQRVLMATGIHYFMEIYESNNKFEQGERLLKKIDITYFDMEVEDISLALKRITKDMNITVEFNMIT